jgi:hypothetical protein
LEKAFKNVGIVLWEIDNSRNGFLLRRLTSIHQLDSYSQLPVVVTSGSATHLESVGQSLIEERGLSANNCPVGFEFASATRYGHVCILFREKKA